MTTKLTTTSLQENYNADSLVFWWFVGYHLDKLSLTEDRKFKQACIEVYRRYPGTRTKTKRFKEVFGKPKLVFDASERNWVYEVTPRTLVEVSIRGWGLLFQKGMTFQEMLDDYLLFFDRVLGHRPELDLPRWQGLPSQ